MFLFMERIISGIWSLVNVASPDVYVFYTNGGREIFRASNASEVLGRLGKDFTS
jgi:hypothetical protein